MQSRAVIDPPIGVCESLPLSALAPGRSDVPRLMVLPGGRHCDAPGADVVARQPPPGADRSPAARSTPTDTTGFAPAGVPPDAAAELLRRAGAGDPRAWEEILHRYSGVVLARVRTYRLQDADALDAVQMTWLRLAENTHRIHHPERLAGWLATTAGRECLHILNQAKRTPTPTDELIDRVTDPVTNPEQRVIDAETAQILRNLVAELSPRRRRLLQALVYTDHPQPYTELAASTGIPVGSIGPTRERALCQLRKMLLRVGALAD